MTNPHFYGGTRLYCCVVRETDVFVGEVGSQILPDFKKFCCYEMTFFTGTVFFLWGMAPGVSFFDWRAFSIGQLWVYVSGGYFGFFGLLYYKKYKLSKRDNPDEDDLNAQVNLHGEECRNSPIDQLSIYMTFFVF